MTERVLDIEAYEPLDIKHYLNAEIKYFRDWQWFHGIDENRPIGDKELNNEILRLERSFREWYFMEFKDDASKVRKK